MSLPIKKVQDIVNQHSKLEKDLSENKIDSKLFAEKSKEYSNLNEIIKFALSYLNFEKNKMDLEKIIIDKNNDEEIKDLAKREIEDANHSHGDLLAHRLQTFQLGRDGLQRRHQTLRREFFAPHVLV